MKTQDLIAAISLFAENEILPGIQNDLIKFSMAGALGILPPIIASNLSGVSTDIDYKMIESFIKSAFAKQPTLTIRVRDLLPQNWETTYPLLRFGPVGRVVNFAFELDQEAGEAFLRYCNNGTHTSFVSAPPSADQQVPQAPPVSSVPPKTL